ncbi:RIP metalloprotease RseP [Acidimangrovimonas sediminis]|uniref:RIP metalloprotease RseP n=1 Tax=Acidimangrovimonas sediminis TaxID=2056283 RepID=UPI000C806A52|nr:RIP metalloprotease RseP [Acidimangrovimonas sediminis]
MDILGLLPSTDGILYQAVAFIIALAIIITVHEYGHYIVGRLSGIKAEVFSLGFGPTLFSIHDRQGTLWRIALLPLGGYVRFAGDADAASARGESGEIAAMTAQERRQTMHGAPLWARAATVLAGPMFNFILSTLIFAGMFLYQGVPTGQAVIGKLRALPGVEGQAAQNFAPGDKIVSVAGKPTPTGTDFAEAAAGLTPSPTVSYGIEKDGSTKTVDGPYPMPPVVAGVTPLSAASDAGLRDGDVITAVDGTPIYAFSQLQKAVSGSDGKQLTLGVWRDGESRQVTLTPRRTDLPTSGGGFETRWLMGISGAYFFDLQTRSPGVVEALKMGVQQIWYTAQTSLSGLYHVATRQISACNLRGPIGIAETSGAAAAQGLTTFLMFIAALSAAVGLLNLFPVPILDGGHLVFHLWEAVTGHPPSERALRVLMGGGLLIIIALMTFALTNDVTCP